MERRLENRAMIEALGPSTAVPERLSYVGAALALLKRELAGSKGPSSASGGRPGRSRRTWSRAAAPRTSPG
jgi:uroporphyrinogen decarboxylase